MADFIRDVVRQPAVVAGNSIGAVTVLSAAYAAPELIRGIVLLNAAGRFDADAAPPPTPPAETGLQAFWRRCVSAAIFYSTKYRIAPILKTVYVDDSKVDAELVQSIYQPACDDNALEAFYKISGSGGRSKQSLNTLLNGARAAKLPLLLLWGLADPWMKPDKADRIVELYPGATLVPLAAGSHCPHDDCPEAVNVALLDWVAALPACATAAK